MHAYKASCHKQTCCRLQDALADFEQALTIEPKNALSHNARGLLLEKMGKPDAALADFETAVQLEGGTNVDFLRNRGLCFRARRDYNKAVEDFNRSASVHAAVTGTMSTASALSAMMQPCLGSVYTRRKVENIVELCASPRVGSISAAELTGRSRWSRKHIDLLAETYHCVSCVAEGCGAMQSVAAVAI